jgi:hypothetical protein
MHLYSIKTSNSPSILMKSSEIRYRYPAELVTFYEQQILEARRDKPSSRKLWYTLSKISTFKFFLNNFSNIVHSRLFFHLVSHWLVRRIMHFHLFHLVNSDYKTDTLRSQLPVHKYSKIVFSQGNSRSTSIWSWEIHKWNEIYSIYIHQRQNKAQHLE